jgi:hypothetical protein
MAETEQQRMARLLLGQGEDQLLAPPVNPMAPPQAIANVLRGVAAKAGQLATTPGTIAAGVPTADAGAVVRGGPVPAGLAHERAV